MRYVYFLLLAIGFASNGQSQKTLKLAPGISLSWHPNIETYFIAERLSVQYINNYVFTAKDSLYRHQPLVYEAYERFRPYLHTSLVKRIANLLQYFRDTYHDNAEVLQYLIAQPAFPARPVNIKFADSVIYRPADHPQTTHNLKELADSLWSFFRQARVKDFLKRNNFYYEGAMREVRKDINVEWLKSMEGYYGENFEGYAMYIMPMMPVTYGEDNYRAFGPVIHTSKGRLAGMFFSSSKMVLSGMQFTKLKEFGFDNPAVTRLLTVHEFGHSFVNPYVFKSEGTWIKDTVLFTPKWQSILEPVYIGNWRTCIIEHLVRTGEIRIALSLNDTAEANRLRRIYIETERFVLIPLLEKKLSEYESHRDKYPTFASFLPELLKVFHDLTPKEIDGMLSHDLTKP
ncbi:MAG: DUF4932 domain-containing protein [Chitinophagaceae bacterium]|nr:DUF4932 domain-containing protein [Chitinophagaceae bacterium]